MRRWRAAAAVLAAAAPLATGTACGIAGSGGDSVATKDELVIGVNGDQPRLGKRTADGGYEGFDVDIAREIAERLGVPGKAVSFKQVTSATREKMIKNGDVDLVVASYSVTPDRKRDVSFAGPYYVAHQDILIRASDRARIGDVHQLGGKNLCKVKGSVSFNRVQKGLRIDAQAVSAEGYTDCLTKLTGGKLDAVSTDDLILAGLAAKAAAEGDGRLAILNQPFTDEPYGVGIAKEDVDGCEAVNKAITEMYQDRAGVVPGLLRKWFSPAALNITATVPQFEGCV